jgi:hypothetical protein
MQIIVEMLYGSHLYGTVTPESDKDIKGIFMPDIRDILLGKIPKSITKNSNNTDNKNTNQDRDIEYYSLHYFVKLALKGETCAIDMLNAPDFAILKSSNIWNNLVSNRKKFYSNNMKAFVGYARSQSAKYGIKGERLKAAKKVMEVLNKHQSWKRLSAFWNQLPKDENHIHYKKCEVSPGIYSRMVVVCGKVIQETVTVEYAKDILNHFIDKYGNRAKSAEQNKGVDWKALSHAIRIALELQELYKTGEITFPLINAKYITEIKQGIHSYLSVANMLDTIMNNIEYFSKESPQNFPEKPNHKFWEDWLFEIVMETIDEYNAG